MAKPKKRNQKNTPQAMSSTPIPQAAQAPTRPLEELRVDAHLLLDQAKDASPEPAPPTPVPAGASADEIIANAWEAQQRFEDATKRTQAKSRELDQERTRLNDERETLVDEQKSHARSKKDWERDVAEQKKQIDSERTRNRGDADRLRREAEGLQAREADAAAGFLRQREEILAPLEKLRTELQSKIDEQARQRLKEAAEHEAQWQELRAERLRAFEAELTKQRENFDTTFGNQQAVLAEVRIEQRKLEAQRALLREDEARLQALVESKMAHETERMQQQIAALTQKLEAARADRDRFHKETQAFEELLRQLGGQSPSALLDRIRALESDKRELERKAADAPSQAVIAELDRLRRAKDGWDEDRLLLEAKLTEAESRLSQLRVGAVAVHSHLREKEALEAGNRLLDAALKELRSKVDGLTKQADEARPFKSLDELDTNPSMAAARRTRPPMSAGQTLAEFCAAVRERIAAGAAGVPLDYSDHQIRAFVAGLAMSRLTLLQGISGTGKTSLPIAFAKAIGAEVERIEVQAGWRDKQELLGYYNAFQGRYYSTKFLEALYRARLPACANRPFLIVLDEINLSRVEQFFADFLSALESNEAEPWIRLMDQPVQGSASRLLVDQGRSLALSPNVWFIGTANHDETTTEFADKTHDRAHIMELTRRQDNQRMAVSKAGKVDPIGFEELREAFKAARERHQSSADEGVKWLKSGIAGFLDDKCRIGWGHRLERDFDTFLPVYVESGGTVASGVDHLFATKVLRKVRDRHDISAKLLDETRAKLVEIWGWKKKGYEPSESLALLDREIRQKRREAE